MNLRTLFRSTKQRQAEKDLLAILKKVRGPHRGIEIPIPDLEAKDPNPNAIVLVAAAEQLVLDHPELTTITVGDRLTLAFRDDVDPLIDPATRRALELAGNLNSNKKP